MSKITEKSTVIPAVVGVGNLNLGSLTIGNMQRGRKLERPYRVSWDGKEFLVGPGVETHAHTINERMEIERLEEGQDYRALIYVDLAEVLESGEPIQVSIVIGYPVLMVQDKQRTRLSLRRLRKWLLGRHQFTVDDVFYDIEIVDIKVMAQPVGTYFAWGLDLNGKWCRDKADLDASVGVCDNGYNTVDLFAIERGNIVAKYVAGEKAGIRRAAETLMREVKAKYDVSLTRHAADRFLREKTPVLSCWSGNENLTPLTTQALENAAAQLVNILETSWGNGKQFRYLLFTGGGSVLLKKHLLQRYPHGVFLPDPILANAHGLARYGRRVFKDAETVIGLDPGFGNFKAVALRNED